MVGGRGKRQGATGRGKGVAVRGRDAVGRVVRERPKGAVRRGERGRCRG